MQYLFDFVLTYHNYSVYKRTINYSYIATSGVAFLLNLTKALERTSTNTTLCSLNFFSDM